MKYLTILNGTFLIHNSHAALMDWFEWDTDSRKHATVYELGRKLEITHEWVIK